MANIKGFNNSSNSNLNLSQQLDINLMPSSTLTNTKEQFDTLNQNYYYNQFYQTNNNDNLINNTATTNVNINSNDSNCNNNNNNKKMKLHGEDFESKQSIYKLLNQQQQQQNENTPTTMYLNQDNNNNNMKNEQLSILKPLREFQLFNQNNLLNNDQIQLNNQIYNNFHQPISNHHHLQNNNHHHLHQHLHNRNDFYIDNHLNTNPLNHTQNIIEQSLVKSLEQTTSLISPSNTGTPTSSTTTLGTTSYPDFTFKYEKNENNMHMNGNTNHSYDDDDDEDEDFENEFDDDTSNSNSNHDSYDYDCDDNFNNDRGLGVINNILTHNNCELKLPGNNNNTSILDGYGNSVYDSPLSLSTGNEENGANCTHLTTLTSRQQLLDAKNNVNSSIQQQQQTKTSLIPSSLANGILPTAISNLLNVKSEHNKNDNLKSNNMTKLGDNTIENTHSMKKSLQYSNYNLNDFELINLPLRELNKRLRYIPKMTAIDLKKRRRTLKNRKYAQNCRSKRLEQKCEMELQNSKLKNEINRLNKEIEKYRKERLVYKAYLEDLFKDPSKLTATISNLKPLHDNHIETNSVIQHDNETNLIDNNNANDLRANNCFMKYD